MSTLIKRLKQNGEQFVPITLAEAVVVNTTGIPGMISEITTLDRVLQKTVGQTNNQLTQINNAISQLSTSKQGKLTPGYGIEISDDNVIRVTTTNQTLYQVVTDLPEASVNTLNMIYIVPIPSEDATNKCAEYICVHEDGVYRWEQFGTFKTDVGLSGYVTEVEFNAKAVMAENVTTSPETGSGVVAVDYDIPVDLYDSYVNVV